MTENLNNIVNMTKGVAGTTEGAGAPGRGSQNLPRPGKTRPGMGQGKSALLAAVAAAALLGVSARPVQASYLLQSANTNVSCNPYTDGVDANGTYNWSVDSTNQLDQQWLWYRVGNSTAQQSINTLQETSAPTWLDTTGDGENDYLQCTYNNAAKTFEITVTYAVTGGMSGSHTSDISQTIQVTNTSSQSLDFHLFDYSNGQLNGSANGQSASITGGSTFTQTSSGGWAMEQTVVSPKPTHVEADTATNLLAALNGTVGLTLDGSTTVNNANAAYAMEYDATLNAGGSLVVTADNQVRAAAIPEPAMSSVAVFGLSGLFLLRPRRRRNQPAARASVAGTFRPAPRDGQPSTGVYAKRSTSALAPGGSQGQGRRRPSSISRLLGFPLRWLAELDPGIATPDCGESC